MLPTYLQNLNPRAYFEDRYFTLDLETTNKDKGDSRTPENRIVMAALKEEGRREAQLIDPKLRRKDIPQRGILVAHNAKFELGWMIRQGLDISELLVWDTMIAEYVLAGNRQWALDLDSVAQRRGLVGKERIIDVLMQGGVCPSEMPEHLLEARVLRDVETTERIFVQQRKELDDAGLLPVMFTRCIVTPVLAFIEREGITLDPTRVDTEIEKQRLLRGQAESAMTIMAGGTLPKKGKQLAAFLYDTLKFEQPRDRRGNIQTTATGKPKTDKNTLANLSAKTEEQKSFLRFQAVHAAADAAITKTLAFYEGVCKEYGGRFMGNFNQCRTKTHRLSSSGRRLTFADGKTRTVQFQNQPREYKPLVCARDPDWVIVEADGMGLEFRVAVDVSQDTQGREDILNPDHDVHTFTATVIRNKEADEITKAERTDAKKHTFKPLFSTGKSGSKAEVKYYQEFKHRYSMLTETQEDWIAEVMRTGQLRLPSGLIAYWNLKMTPSGFVEGSNQVRNLPIQSFATADIIPVSLVYTFWRARHTVQAKLINTVHDSVAAEVAKKDVDKYREIVITSFLTDTYNYLNKVYGHKMFVPLGVGMTIGEHWGEGEEFKYTEEPKYE